MKLSRIFGGVTLAMGLVASPLANAITDPTYSFGNITANNVNDAATGESQLTMTVTAYGVDTLGRNQVLFTFNNSGPNASSITDIYFDDGALLGIADFISSSGVSFGIMASPGNLPGASPYNFRPEYDGVSNRGFSADSESPTQPNGVNPGESLGIVFTLQGTKTYADVLTSLARSQTDIHQDIEGGLRVGIHVQGFAGGGSESFLNGGETGNQPVPDASSTLTLLGLALVGISTIRRRLS